MTTTTRRFFTVAILMSLTDNATSVTFDNLPDAIRHAAWGTRHGAWFVSVWS